MGILKRQFTVGCELQDHLVSLIRRYNRMAIVYLVFMFIYLLKNAESRPDWYL